MKKTLIRIGSTLALLATMAVGAAGGVSAQGLFPAYTSSVQVANLESTAANVTLAGYNSSDGSQAPAINPLTIPANGSIAIFPLSVPNGFSGSLVISSDKKVAAISNIVTPSFSAGAAYVGRSVGGTKVLLPLLNKGNGGFNTWFSVQNAGSGDASVTINYSDNTSVGPITIKEKASHVFYQATETHSAKNFSGIVTSNQPVVAAVIQEDGKILFAYTGFADTDATTNPLVPLVNSNNGGYRTAIQVQNAGTAATDVTLTFTPLGGGAGCTEKHTISPGSSANYAFAAFENGDPGSNCTPKAKFVGSASVTANTGNQPLVAIINQLKSGLNGEAYVSFNAAQATNKVVLPLIMDRNGGYFTGINVQNVGSAATTVNCTFTNSTYTVSKTLQPNEALNDLQNNKIANKYVGGATCTAANATDKIVGVVNELGASTTGDQLLVYEGAASQ